MCSHLWLPQSTLSSISQAIHSLFEQIKALTHQQASHQREVERQNGEIARQDAELESLRQLVFSFAHQHRSEGHAQTSHKGLYPDSRRPSLAISLASGMSVASSSAVPSPHDRQDSYGMPLGSSSLRSSLQPSNYSSTSSNTPYLHKSASGLLLRSSASSAAPEVESPAGTGSPQTFAQMAASNAAGMNTSPTQQMQARQYPSRHLQRAPTMPTMQYHPFARNQMQQLAAGVMGQFPPSLTASQHPSSTSSMNAHGHPSMPPRYQSASELYSSSSRSRASSTSAYAASTASQHGPGASMAKSIASNPFHAMAAASGVILGEYEVGHTLSWTFCSSSG